MRSRAVMLSALGWLLFFSAITLIGWVSLLRHLHSTVAQTEQRALAAAESEARSYASYLQQTLTAADQIILTVRFGWERTGGNLRLEDMLESGMFISSPDFYLGIFDARGQLVTNTVPGSPATNASTAPFFIRQKETPADFLYIDRPAIGTFTKREVVRMTRKLTSPQREFAGVIVGSVTTNYLTAIYDSMGLGPHDFIGVLGDDGVPRATRIGNTVTRQGTSALLAVPEIRTTSGRAVWIGGERFGDGRTRYVGWSAISNYPLFALSGRDQADVFAPYLDYRAAVLRNGALATAAFALFVLVAAYLSIRLNWRKHLNDEMQAAYRLATESGTEGFYIVEPVHDESGATVDYAFVDCNRRGAQFLGTEPERVIGRRISDFYDGRLPVPIRDMLLAAFERGKYESEMKTVDYSPFLMEWAQFNVIRADHRLAVALRDISSTKAHVSELERRSYEDTLTGLPNRLWLNNYLPRAVSQSGENRTMLAVLFIDLDGFKRVNDMMGHDVGDELLRNAGRRLKLAVRPGDHVARMGGDEFVVVLENIHYLMDAAHVADRILKAFKESFKLSKGIHSIGTSIGISMFPSDGMDAATLLKNADIAMYSVKSGGKRNYRFYDQQFDEALNARHRDESELRHALEAGQLVMYYQPRIDVATGETTSMEALVRWAHPTRGIVEPAGFITLAEETGLIIELGRQVIDLVCAQLAAWQTQGQALVPVSINVSARQFDEANIGQILTAAIERHGVDPHLVEIELTESAVSRNSEDAARILGGIQGMGIKLLVDDFGTGYSSLSQLQQLDFDVLKVDRAFTAQLEESKEGAALFRAIITMAHELGMRVVAEGVETLDQIKALASLHCDEIQGFFVSRPMPPPDNQAALLRSLSLAG